MTIKDKVQRFIAGYPNYTELDPGEQNALLYKTFPKQKRSYLRKIKNKMRIIDPKKQFDHLQPLQIPRELFETKGARAARPIRRVDAENPSRNSPSAACSERRYERITLETVHDLLLRWANGEDIDHQLVRYCIDYCKGFKEDVEQEEIDLNLEEFKEIGEIVTDRRIVRPRPE